MKYIKSINTWPPLDLSVEPALMVLPKVDELPGKQWAAQSKVDSSKIVAPQKWELNDCTETCHGIGDGASWPPTISAVSNLVELVM